MDQRTPEWHEARLGRVTGSAVGAILGLSPYMTRTDVLRSMIRATHGAESEFTGNVATEYGVYNEAGALAEYQMETGRTVVPCGFYKHEDWLGASPDGLIGDDGLIEIKCPFGIRKEGAFKPLADHPHYYAQIQVQLFVTDRKWCDFYQWAAHGTKLERVEIDRIWLAENLPELRVFWGDYLDENDDPEPYLEAKRAVVDTLDAARMVAEYDQLADAIDRAEARKKELLADMVRIAGARNAVFGGRNLTKTERAGSVSYAKALAKYAPNADLEPFRGKPVEYWQLK